MENESHGAQMWVVSERLAGAMTRPGHAAAKEGYQASSTLLT